MQYMGVNIWAKLCHIDSIMTQLFQSDVTGLLEYLLIFKAI